MGLKDLTRDSIFKAIQEFDDLGRDAFLRKYGFHASREYFLEVNGKPYDSKAIAGVAHGYLEGQNVLRSAEFSGGDNTVRPVLDRLGFSIRRRASYPTLELDRIYARVPRSDAIPGAATSFGYLQTESLQNTDAAGRPWSDIELKACVEAYHKLWQSELAGHTVVKAQLARETIERDLKGRTKSSYEFRMQNISAVLADIGVQWVKGYPPARNVGPSIVARLQVIISEFWPGDDVGASVINTNTSGGSEQGQGRGLSAAQRRAVENRAMQVSEYALLDEGYTVVNTSFTEPFDYLAAKEGRTIKVEVKGTTSRIASKIIMTRNEVELHLREQGQTALFTVSGIELTLDGDKWVASGGKLTCYYAWDISACARQPLSYEVALN